MPDTAPAPEVPAEPVVTAPPGDETPAPTPPGDTETAPIPGDLPPEPEVAPEPEPKPEPPKAEEPPPPPEPAAAEPEPEPEPPKPEPPPEALAELAPPPPKPKTKPEPPPVKDVTPEKKPPPPDQMDSILKTVEKLKDREPEPKPKEKEESFLETAEKLKKRDQVVREYDSSAPVTISQIDAIRRHFEKCWNIPAGARDAEDLAVQIRVAMAPDATVRTAEIVQDGRLYTDEFYRAAAESARRAVLNPRCRSLKGIGLRPEQYDQWRDMVITFNPKQMIGA